MSQKEKPLFVIDHNPAVDWPVIVKLPADGGTFEEYQFTAKFRVLSPAGYAALFAAGDAAADLAMQEVLKDNVRQFAELVVGWGGSGEAWEGPTDINGNPVPFTPEELAAQVAGPRGAELSAGLWVAIREIRSGARLGNSVPPSVAG